MTKIRILNSGILTTIQDGGRLAGLSLGLAQSGVMDHVAYRLAMALLNSKIEGPVIEVTGGHFSMIVDSACEIAVTGANSDVFINDTKIQLWQSFQLMKDDKLVIKDTRNGLRNYIAIKGTWLNIQLYKKSYATDLKAGIGGYFGRKLNRDDVIEIQEEITNQKYKAEVELELKKNESIQNAYFRQLYSNHKIIRVCDGPQVDAFSKEMRDVFYNAKYEVSSFSDRMGIRLKGEKISHKEKADIITDVVAFGAIQIPGDGLPIVMMADRQGTGGYTKIANVVFEDLSILAQAVAGDTVQFVPCDLVNLEKNHIEIKSFHIKETAQYKMTLEEINQPSSAKVNFDIIVETLLTD
ncbi:5-oxoprolinase subunit C family protein [Fusibacter bizertensis]